MTKRIGIVAQEQDGNVFGVNNDYLSLIAEFGTPVILSPMDKELFFQTYKLDGLVLPGGSDVDPKRYNAWTHFKAYRPNSFLEWFDTQILPELISEDFPIFGICRGLQTLNVYFGGSLYQHLWRHPYSSHGKDFVHKTSVKFTEDGKTYVMKTNSFHHQAIKNLGKGLVVLGEAEDKTIEAISHKELPIKAVQWHPERQMDEFSLSLMKELFS